jgi:hypothetical protein
MLKQTGAANRKDKKLFLFFAMFERGTGRPQFSPIHKKVPFASQP